MEVRSPHHQFNQVFQEEEEEEGNVKDDRRVGGALRAETCGGAKRSGAAGGREGGRPSARREARRGRRSGAGRVSSGAGLDVVETAAGGGAEERREGPCGGRRGRGEE